MSTPNMNLVLPTASVTPGPTWAQELNDALTAVDSHDHTSGQGVAIPAAALNIDDNVDCGGNDLTNVRSVRLLSGSAALTGVLDNGCVYEYGGDLYYNNSTGQPVQVTAGSAIAAAGTGSIQGLTPPASVAYSGITKTFTFQQAANQAAGLDAGNVTIRKMDAASQPGVSLVSPTLAGNYTLTLPTALPTATLPVQLASNGQLSTGPVTTAQITDAAITSAKLASGAITNAMVSSALGYQPVREGNGFRQSPNAVKIGWTGTRVAVTVDNTDIGDFITTAANGQIQDTQIQDGAVTTSKISDGNVTAGKIASTSVDKTKLSGIYGYNVRGTDGAVRGQQGDLSTVVSLTRTGTGAYQLIDSRASLNSIIQVTLCAGTHTDHVQATFSAGIIFIDIFNSAGSVADHDFYILVHI